MNKKTGLPRAPKRHFESANWLTTKNANYRQFLRHGQHSEIVEAYEQILACSGCTRRPFLVYYVTMLGYSSPKRRCSVPTARWYFETSRIVGHDSGYCQWTLGFPKIYYMSN